MDLQGAILLIQMASFENNPMNWNPPNKIHENHSIGDVHCILFFLRMNEYNIDIHTRIWQPHDTLMKRLHSSEIQKV
jgi:hypothetical protein